MMTIEEFDAAEKKTYELLDSKVELIKQIVNAEGSIELDDLADKIEELFSDEILPNEFHNDIFNFVAPSDLEWYIKSRKIGNVTEEVTITYTVHKIKGEENG